jgi:hypothetical protein
MSDMESGFRWGIMERLAVVGFLAGIAGVVSSMTAPPWLQEFLSSSGLGPPLFWGSLSIIVLAFIFFACDLGLHLARRKGTKKLLAALLIAGGITATISGLVILFDASPATKSKEIAASGPAPTPSTPQSAAPKAQPTGVHKYIVEGLTKAREDLVGIKKEELSCDALAAWQARADTATRLAHANGIGIHNPISQHLSACRNIADVELLDAIRTSIVQLLDQGIQAAGG